MDTMSTNATPDAVTAVAERNRRRDEIAGAVFTLWIVAGLFVDGWAHNVEKPEDFFTPWHALLYSGFVASLIWFGIEGRRRRASGTATPPPTLILVGYGLFAAGGILDGVWHQVFGVEVDTEALVSPTHLTLVMGGLLLATETVRTMRARAESAPSLRTFLPAIVGIAAPVAVLSFFTQFASAFKVADHDIFSGFASEQSQSLGIAAILLTNLLLIGAVAFTIQRWRTPPGTFTLMLGGTGLLMSTQLGFDQIALVAPAVAAGVVADVLVAQGRSGRTVLLVTPAVLWVLWFAVYHAGFGLGWAAELWTGTIFFAVLTGFGMSLLGDPGATPRAGTVAPHTDTRPDAGTLPAGAPYLTRTPHRALAELLL